MAKVQLGLGTPNPVIEKEALGFINKQTPAVEKRLAVSPYLAGSEITIADLFAFAYMENAKMAQIPMDAYPHLAKWYSDIKSRDSTKRAFSKLGREYIK